MPDPQGCGAGPAAAAGARGKLILSFDFGRRRVGVACGDTVSKTAAPLRTIICGEHWRWEPFDALLEQWQPDLLVVGLPYNVDGSDGSGASSARAFAAGLAERYSLRVALIDERYSSLEAESRLRSARAAGSRKRRVAKADVDAAAACIILERWFSENSVVECAHSKTTPAA